MILLYKLINVNIYVVKLTDANNPIFLSIRSKYQGYKYIYNFIM